MGRRELRDEIQDTWMVMHEPKDRDGNRHARRARAAQARCRQRTISKLLSRPTVPTMALYRTAIPDGPVTHVPISVRADESSEVRRPPAPRDSSVPTEGG